MHTFDQVYRINCGWQCSLGNFLKCSLWVCLRRSFHTHQSYIILHLSNDQRDLIDLWWPLNLSACNVLRRTVIGRSTHVHVVATRVLFIIYQVVFSEPCWRQLAGGTPASHRTVRNVPRLLGLSPWWRASLLAVRSSTSTTRTTDTSRSSGTSSWPSLWSSFWSQRTTCRSACVRRPKEILKGNTLGYGRGGEGSGWSLLKESCVYCTCTVM